MPVLTRNSSPFQTQHLSISPYGRHDSGTFGHSHDAFPQRLRFRAEIAARVTSGASWCREMLFSPQKEVHGPFLLRSIVRSGQYRLPCTSHIHVIPMTGFPGLHFLQDAAYLFLIMPFAYFPHPIGKRSTQMRFHPLHTFSVSGSVCIVSP